MTVAGKPRTSPGSETLRISVLPSADEVESLTRPVHKMKTPRGACPSTNRVAPFGYAAAEVMAASLCTARGERLQNSRSSRCGQARQLSIISNPYGARMTSPPRSIPPSLHRTKRNPLGVCGKAVVAVSFAIRCFYRNRTFVAVMAVTLQCDGGYSNPVDEGPYFKRNVGGAKCTRTSEIS